MAKRKKRAVTMKKKKEEEEDKEEDLEEPASKKVSVSSTSVLEEELSQGSSFNVQGLNIVNSESTGGEIGFCSHFWCNYCEFSSDSKKELVAHMRQHMTKCSYCLFSSLSKAEIAKHVKCEHADEVEKTICEVDSSSSSTEHDMDKDPCSACIFCDFMTYSTEHLEKHTTAKHQGMLPKSVAKMISKQNSARVRRADALFYGAISSDSLDRSSEVESVISGTTADCSEDKGPIVIEPDNCSVNVKKEADMKASLDSPPPIHKPDVKPNPSTLSKPVHSEQTEGLKSDDWKVKVETLYCLSCPYSNVATEKLKCHSLTQHPLGAAASSFNSEGACRLQDIAFFCVREQCSYSNVQCANYEEHLVTCCSKQSLSPVEVERLKATIEFILKFQKKESIKVSEAFNNFSSKYLHNLQSNDHVKSVSNSADSNELKEKPEPCSVQPGVHHTDARTIVYHRNDSGSNSPGIPSPSFQNIPNPCSEPDAGVFPDPFASSSKNFSQPQVTSDQQGFSQIHNNSNLGQDDASNFSVSSKSFNSELHTQSMASGGMPGNADLSMRNPNFASQTPVESQQTAQPVHSSMIDNSFVRNSSPITTNFNNGGIHNQEPASFDVNTNTVSADSQSMFSQAALPIQPQVNSGTPMSTPFPSAHPTHSDHGNQSFPAYTSVQQQLQGPPLNPSLTSVTSQAMHPPTILSDVQQPKMLDLLTDTHSILLDDDLDAPSWPSSLGQVVPSSQPAQSQSLPAVTQQSLCTPPLPLPQTTFPPQSNQAGYAARSDVPPQTFPSFPQHSASLSDQPTIPIQPQLCNSQTYQNQSNMPIQHSEPAAIENPTATDLSSQQAYSSMADFPNHAQINPQTPGMVTGSGSHQTSAFNADKHTSSFSSEGDTLSNYNNHQGESSSVPNFLVPSSNVASAESGANSQQPNSFLNTPAPPHFPGQQAFSADQPSTPSMQKNLPAGQGKFLNGNSPLSPSIYLSGKSPRQQQQMMMQGQPLPQLRMHGPQLVGNMGLSSPHARQRLFAPQLPQTRGHPRGPRMSSRMPRPPMKRMDDDVIVTAVVRGPAPPRPPMNQRGRGGPPIPRGRGMMPRGRGGRPPKNSPSQQKRPFDVSRHFVDLACAVNANEENEGDEIQIVAVTPGKGGKTQPKAVDAKKFSYCCIHCGKDQGSKQVMKQHIKANHSESLLGALRNVETGQWLYFCPQLTCEFMTYDENRLTDHLFSCYNYDRNKQLPIDMQSALRNLKSLKIRQVNVQPNTGGGVPANPIDLESQGLRDAFNNNLKNAFDDMVENAIGRQTGRPAQPPHPPQPMNQHPSRFPPRGAIRGPYSPRGYSPRLPRQNLPRPGEMPPGYRQRNPMMGGSPRQPRYYPPLPGRQRGPGPAPHPRGMPPARGRPSLRGQRAPSRGFMPRPSLAAGMPGNEQMPIVIDLDDDTPEPMAVRTGQVGPPATMVGSDVPGISSISSRLDSTQTVHLQGNTSHELLVPLVSSTPAHQAQTGISGQPSEPVSSFYMNNQTLPPVNVNPHDMNTPVSLSDCQSGGLSSSIQPCIPVQRNDSVANLSQECLSSENPPSGESPPMSLPPQQPITTSATTSLSSTVAGVTSSLELTASGSPPSSAPVVDGQTAPSHSGETPAAAAAAATAIRDIPSPTQLMAEMNAMCKNPIGNQASTTEAKIAPQEAAVTESHDAKSPNSGSTENLPSGNDDEEKVNTILLDKVFAKVPHMPKKLSQRLVLKFKKYAADRGVIITPTSKVIDEFVSKISYKGSHSAPSAIPETKAGDGNAQAPQPLNTNSNLPADANVTTTPGDSVLKSSSSAVGEPANDSNWHRSAAPLPAPGVDLHRQLSPPAQSESTTNGTKPAMENPYPDVIETKNIVPERSLQFSGTFANIVKARVLPEKSSPDVPEKREGWPPERRLSELSSSPSRNVSPSMSEGQLSSAEDSVHSLMQESHDMLRKVLKKEIDPISFPSGSREESIEVKSSVDHLVCGHANLEVDIAGTPLSASDFTDRVMGPVDLPRILDKEKPDFEKSKKDCERVSMIDDTSGKLILKVKKSGKPRVPFFPNKKDEGNSVKEDEISAITEDHAIRRSDRKRKVVKIDYEPDEMDEMDELMSDEDEEYHMESDDSYDGSGSDTGWRKKGRKSKASQEPSAFDLKTKGLFQCWNCSKTFSRVMFVKRHILKKHKGGMCAIVLSESDIPTGQPCLLLFCPQNCRYVTFDTEAFSTHLKVCDQTSLDVEEGVTTSYKQIQQNFFDSEFKSLVDGIAAGTISTKPPVKKRAVSRKKTAGKASLPNEHVDQQPHCNDSNTITTTAIIHPQSSSALMADENGEGYVEFETADMHEFPEEPPSLTPVYPAQGHAEVDDNLFVDQTVDGYDHSVLEENQNDFDQEYQYDDHL